MAGKNDPYEQGELIPRDRTPAQPPEKRFTRSDAKLIAFGILALLAGIFVGQNTNQVVVHFVFGKAKIRLIWVFLLCIGIGVALDRLLTWRGLLPAARKRHPKDRSS